MLKQAAYTAAQSVAGIFTKSLQLGEKTVEVANTTANFVNSTVGLADKTVGVAGKSTDVINEAQDTAIDQLKNVSDLTKSATKFSTKTIETLTEQLNGVSATSQEGLKLVTAAGAILSGALIENKPEFSKLIAFPVKIASGVSNTISTLVRLILIIPFDSFEKTIDRLRLAREKRLATIQTQTDKQNEIAVLKLELEKLELLRKLNEAANAKQSTLDKIVENPTEKIGDGLNAVRADTTVVGKIITDETPSLKNSI
ncbi:hypothetical protein EB093_08500, partial [bacterium]|nr:hypothetical protein [bacterium]